MRSDRLSFFKLCLRAPRSGTKRLVLRALAMADSVLERLLIGSIVMAAMSDVAASAGSAYSFPCVPRLAPHRRRQRAAAALHLSLPRRRSLQSAR